MTSQSNPQSADDAPHVENEADKKRLRQQERTVDNLNRLFAMLFSIVFSVAAASLIQKFIKYTVSIDPRPIIFDVDATVFNVGSLLILAMTAAVFFHQASRGLDLAYSSSSRLKPHPSALAVDFGVIAATMVPFVLMARSLDEAVTDSIGFFLFFFAHEVLIVFGLIWVSIRLIRFHLLDSISDTFKDVSVGVERFWLMMNSVYIFLTATLFMVFSGYASGEQTCPLIPHRGASLTFFLIFITLATARNCIDYFTLFNVFFPVKPENSDGTQKYSRILMFCINAKSVRSLNIKLPNLVGFLFLVLAYIVIFHITKLYDLGRWARLCSVSGH